MWLINHSSEAVNVIKTQLGDKYANLIKASVTPDTKKLEEISGGTEISI